MNATAKRCLQNLLLGIVIVTTLFALKLPAGHADASINNQKATRVALFVNGTLGDKSFFDSAARGLAQARQDLGLRTRVVEAGLDPSRWESSFEDLAEGHDFDIIATGGFAMVALVQRIAPQYPTTHFIVFDAAVDYAQCRCENVHSMLFRQNEGAYLAGFLAARVSETSSGATPVRLGAVGGMQIPVVDDFLLGFDAGAKAARPDVQLLRQYVNSFNDPATAKEIAKAMYGKGVALIFHAAAGSGQGVIEASAEAHRAAVGVDSDQYAIFKTSNPERARYILTSVLKNVDAALLHALRRQQAGQLVFGRVESLGLAEGGISLAAGSDMLSALPPQILNELAGVRRQLIDGSIKVPSVFDTHPTQ